MTADFDSVRAGMVVVSVACVGMLLGGLLPWAKLGPIAIAGDSTADGMAATGCALAALCIVGMVWAGGRPMPLLVSAMLLLLAVAAIAVIDGRDLGRLASDTPGPVGDPTAGSGLWLTSICAAAGAVGAFFSAAVQPLRREAVAPVEDLEIL